MFIEKRNGLVILVTGTMMLDWDMPADGHKDDRCISISKREDAYEIIHQWCQKHHSYLFKVYDTPGGVRAFCLSHTFNWRNTAGYKLCEHFMSRLDCDKLYTKFSCMNQNGWRARVSPKPNRENDYVAKHFMWMGYGAPTKIHINNVDAHDKLIVRYTS